MAEAFRSLRCGGCGAFTVLPELFMLPGQRTSAEVLLKTASTSTNISSTFFGETVRKHGSHSIAAVRSKKTLQTLAFLPREPNGAGARYQACGTGDFRTRIFSMPSWSRDRKPIHNPFTSLAGFRGTEVACHAAGPSVVPPIEQRIIKSTMVNQKTKGGGAKPGGGQWTQKKSLPKPRLTEEELSSRLLPNQEIMLKYPLLGSLLPLKPLSERETAWINENLDKVKAALKYPLPEMAEAPEGHPVAHLDTLLYCSLAAKESALGKIYSRSTSMVHGRLALLGLHVCNLAMAEFLLQRYPREVPAALRERAAGMTGKKVLPGLLSRLGIDSLLFPEDQNMGRAPWGALLPVAKGVFYSIIATGYVTLGLGEVMRLLFDVFELNPDGPECAPMPRAYLVDEDHVSTELEGEGRPPLSWQEVAGYVRPAGSHLAHPRLYQAAVPPGMTRFRGSAWDRVSLPLVMRTLGYPLRPAGASLASARAARDDLALAVQLSFMHTSLHKQGHPRFSYERLEYVGAMIQDLVMVERLLQKYFDAPGPTFIARQHQSLLRNRTCGRYLREQQLQSYIQFSEEAAMMFEKNRVGRVLAQAAVHQALHGAAYVVYGKSEVRRLMFELWKLDGGWLT